MKWDTPKVDGPWVRATKRFCLIATNCNCGHTHFWERVIAVESTRRAMGLDELKDIEKQGVRWIGSPDYLTCSLDAARAS